MFTSMRLHYIIFCGKVNRYCFVFSKKHKQINTCAVSEIESFFIPYSKNPRNTWFLGLILALFR